MASVATTPDPVTAMHAPRCPVALLTTALLATALGGCDKLTTTTIVRNLQDDTRNDRSWTKLWKDSAEFRCVASTGGTCHVVVFASDCPAAACTTHVLGELTLPAGTSRRLTGLPRGFKHCIAHDARPVAPACLKA